MNRPTPATLKSDFDRDGVVVIRNFVTPETVYEIRTRAEQATRGDTRADMFSNITKGLEHRDAYFGELLNNGPQMPVLESLLGEKPTPTTASFFTKDDNAQEVHPHADAIEGVVTWIALDETARSNGCLHFIKGSHKRKAEFAHLRADTPEDLHGHPDAFEAAMGPGDIVIFKPNTVHWSGPNHDGSPRRGFNCFYIGAHPHARELYRKKTAGKTWQKAGKAGQKAGKAGQAQKPNKVDGAKSGVAA